MFILASASPRRKMLLEQAGFTFKVVASHAKEIKSGRIAPDKIAIKNAIAKAEDVYSDDEIPCLGADTIVVLDGKVLGKPSDKAENAEFLRQLSGRTHQVVTGYCLIVGDEMYVDSVTSDVTFNNLSDELIEKYVESGTGLDKAGGYGIQDGYDLIKSINGSYSNVVGLPMEAVTRLLKEKL